MVEAEAPHRRFWVLWSASTATNLGDGMRVVALPLLATGVTTDVRQIALVTVATFAPLLVFGPRHATVIRRPDGSGRCCATCARAGTPSSRHHCCAA
jgi:uncharacterized membrane protein YhaH (DUF805 family)